MKTDSTNYDLTAIDYAALGLRINTCRFVQHVTQEKLAEQVGISITYLSRIENGRKRPSLACVLRIAHALNVPVSYLLSGEGFTLRRNSNTPKSDSSKLVPMLLDDLSAKEQLFACELLSDTIQLLHRYYPE